MESKSNDTNSQVKKSIAVNWDASEWFQVWLKLTRQQGKEQTEKTNSLQLPKATAT